MRGRVLGIGGAWDADRVQAALNVVGGVAFSAGSLLFLDASLARVGVALFVLGSFAMAFGATAVWRQRYGGRREAHERPETCPVSPAGFPTPPSAPGTRR